MALPQDVKATVTCTCIAGSANWGGCYSGLQGGISFTVVDFMHDSLLKTN